MKIPISETTERIRALARTHGFDAVGFTAAQLPPRHEAHLREFLAAGYHGEMGWMEARVAERTNPAQLWQEVKTVIVLGQNYAPAIDPMARLEDHKSGVISVYALGKDYHDVIKKKLKALCRDISALIGGEYKVFVDTAPVMEKPLAAQTQLGWQGKHTCIVSRQFGSWLFLGEIFTSLALPPDVPETPHCGSCRSCIDICPTQAIVAEGKLDARRCISYLTIEHQSHIPTEFRRAIGNRIYGCDDCLAVCPWNKFAQNARETAYHANPALIAPALASLAALDDAAFRTLFSGSPVKRIGRNRFVRNVLIAIGNSGDASLTPIARTALADASPLVRAMAVWALSQLAPPEDFSALRESHLPAEQDPAIIAEWNLEGTEGPHA